MARIHGPCFGPAVTETDMLKRGGENQLTNFFLHRKSFAIFILIRGPRSRPAVNEIDRSNDLRITIHTENESPCLS